MFAALFDASGRRMPIDRLAIVASALPNPTQVFAAGANVAFIKSPTGEAADIDSCLKPPSGGPTGLIGRIRLDRRSTLRERLGAASGASDADLLIGAYERWGDDFLRHVRGDYCFVLVDSPRRRLIAARDQLGVRALFYARRGDLWLISDSLDWLAAQWPRRPDLDEYWIGDFLTLGHSREFRRTVYRDIHRVPPGHCLQLDERDNSLRRYWQLEIAEPLHLKHAGEYAERFRELMAEAISDRLPKGTVGIAMSGGIDSTSLAALSIELKKDASQVVAECIHYKRLMNVGEDRYARLAARDIGIDLVVRPFDDLVYDQSWRSRGIAAAEPTQSLLDAHHLRAFGQERSRRAVIWFEGEGPDNALDLERDAYLKWLWRRREWVRFGAACVQYAFVKGASGWRQTLNRHVTRSMSAPRLTDIPRWLQREFVHDLDLQQRIENLGAGGMPGHPWHPVAISSFTSPVFQGYFGDCDFQESLAPIVHRHPYLDVRVVEFMLRVPPIPWGWKKRLMRVAMRGRLPREVLEREKTPLPLHPDVAAAREQGLGELVNRDGLQRYVDPARLPDVHAAPPEVRGLFAVHALDGWLSEREGSTLRRDAISAILET